MSSKEKKNCDNNTADDTDLNQVKGKYWVLKYDRSEITRNKRVKLKVAFCSHFKINISFSIP